MRAQLAKKAAATAKDAGDGGPDLGEQASKRDDSRYN